MKSKKESKMHTQTKESEVQQAQDVTVQAQAVATQEPQAPWLTQVAPDGTEEPRQKSRINIWVDEGNTFSFQRNEHCGYNYLTITQLDGMVFTITVSAKFRQAFAEAAFHAGDNR